MSIKEENWSFLAAMERSHRWHVTASTPADKRCGACGDTLDDMVRYCPGVGAPIVKKEPARIQVPPLERIDGVV